MGHIISKLVSECWQSADFGRWPCLCWVWGREVVPASSTLKMDFLHITISLKSGFILESITLDIHARVMINLCENMIFLVKSRKHYI